MKKKCINEMIRIYGRFARILDEIAEDETTSPDILRRLSRLTHDPNIINGVYTNSNTPVELLKKKANTTGDEELRAHITCNFSLPMNILQKMLEKDPSEFVREVAALSMTKRLLKGEDKVGKKKLAGLYKLLKNFKDIPKKDIDALKKLCGK